MPFSGVQLLGLAGMVVAVIAVAVIVSRVDDRIVQAQEAEKSAKRGSTDDATHSAARVRPKRVKKGGRPKRSR
jgi:hypothetical protein